MDINFPVTNLFSLEKQILFDNGTAQPVELTLVTFYDHVKILQNYLSLQIYIPVVSNCACP